MIQIANFSLYSLLEAQQESQLSQPSEYGGRGSASIPDEKKRHIDPEGGYDDLDEALSAEKSALAGQ